jgi:hypothetical protein
MAKAMPILLLALLLAACERAPADDSASCCETPAPGSVTVHTNAEVTNGVAVWHRQ